MSKISTSSLCMSKNSKFCVLPIIYSKWLQTMSVWVRTTRVAASLNTIGGQFRMLMRVVRKLMAATPVKITISRWGKGQSWPITSHRLRFKAHTISRIGLSQQAVRGKVASSQLPSITMNQGWWELARAKSNKWLKFTTVALCCHLSIRRNRFVRIPSSTCLTAHY